MKSAKGRIPLPTARLAGQVSVVTRRHSKTTKSRKHTIVTALVSRQQKAIVEAMVKVLTQ